MQTTIESYPISPLLRLWGLGVVSVSVCANIAWYYMHIMPMLVVVPVLVYVATVVIVLGTSFSSSYHRLLLIHAYVTLPLTLPLLLPLPSGFFIYLSSLVVLFFNALITHGEIRRLRAEVPSWPLYGGMLIGGVLSGGAIAYFIIGHTAVSYLPLLLTIAGGCLLRPRIIEPVFPEAPTTPSLVSHLLGRVAQWRMAVPVSLIRYQQLAALVAFVLLLLLLAASYRHIIPLIGTMQVYKVNIYMIAYGVVMVGGCFAFRAKPHYFSASIMVSVLISVLFFTQSAMVIEIPALGASHLSVERVMLMSAILLAFGVKSPVLYSVQTPYGLLQVQHNRLQSRLELINDAIIHGIQSYDNNERMVPHAYYGRQGPFGQIYSAFAHDPRTLNIAVIGLGVGTVAAYGRPGQKMTFYEVNPEVEHIASTMGYFTYLDESPADITIVIGDARDSLSLADDGAFGMIIGDAYSGRATPRHLLTREAFALYKQKLQPGGIMLLNVIGMPVATLRQVALAAAAVGLQGFSRHYVPAHDNGGSGAVVQSAKGGLLPEKKPGFGYSDPVVKHWMTMLERGLAQIGVREERKVDDLFSHWAVLAENSETITVAMQDARWKKLPTALPETTMLTDEECGYDRWDSMLTKRSSLRSS